MTPAGGLQGWSTKYGHLDDKNPRNIATWPTYSPLCHPPYYGVRRGESGDGFLPEGARFLLDGAGSFAPRSMECEKLTKE